MISLNIITYLINYQKKIKIEYLYPTKSTNTYNCN